MIVDPEKTEPQSKRPWTNVCICTKFANVIKTKTRINCFAKNQHSHFTQKLDPTRESSGKEIDDILHKLKSYDKRNISFIMLHAKVSNKL